MIFPYNYDLKYLFVVADLNILLNNLIINTQWFELKIFSITNFHPSETTQYRWTFLSLNWIIRMYRRQFLKMYIFYFT